MSRENIEFSSYCNSSHTNLYPVTVSELQQDSSALKVLLKIVNHLCCLSLHVLLGICSTTPSGLQLEEISLRLVKVCRMYTETSRCGTAVDNVTLSWAEAGADPVAEVCMQNKAKALTPTLRGRLASIFPGSCLSRTLIQVVMSSLALTTGT